ncbi:uncharacterized protein FIBRA_07751 [Fibroporia radiculosa]|uniref:Uncharacterized protein n=1 Tax=Fibroporia radiculosa TaxID=599839 RepID=J4GVJ5_9APHY|nr:uncharacterized protein FIBRA_07751 [Fibroporia radiculosa]CCM05525.1 predicted protein [Fibroporia radiculosa]
MASIREFEQDARESDYENDLYLGWDVVLNNLSLRNTQRRGSDGKKLYRILVHPQPAMSCPDGFDPNAVIEESTRVLRSHASDGDFQELSSEFLDLTLSSIASDVTVDDPGSAIPHPSQKRPTRFVDPKRIPDFNTLLFLPDGVCRLLFLHEIKPYPHMFWRGDEFDEYSLNSKFEEMVQQVVQQAQVAAYHFSAEKEIHVMCCIGLFFRVLTFPRAKLPPFGQVVRSSDQLEAILSSPFREWTYLLREDKKDYHKDYKRVWSDVRNAKSQAEKQRNRRG